jgi:hypothetical protein
MSVGAKLSEEPSHQNCSLEAEYASDHCLRTIAAALVAVALLVGLPARADEFDALAVYSEARPLNDRWQACAAFYVRRRLQSQVSSNSLARDALRKCRTHESRLRRFFVRRIGSRSAENVVAVLRLRYQADLAAAINALRTHD